MARHFVGTPPARGREHFDIHALALVLDVADNYPAIIAAA